MKPRAVSLTLVTLNSGFSAEKNGSQALSLGPGNTVTTPSGLCVTFTGGSPAPLTLEPCVSGDKAQEWLFNPAAGTFEGSPAGSCVAWNAQGGGGMEGPGSRVGTWTCTEIGFNSVFAPNVPSPGLIGYNFSSAVSVPVVHACLHARLFVTEWIARLGCVPFALRSCRHLPSSPGLENFLQSMCDGRSAHSSSQPSSSSHW